MEQKINELLIFDNFFRYVDGVFVSEVNVFLTFAFL